MLKVETSLLEENGIWDLYLVFNGNTIFFVTFLIDSISGFQHIHRIQVHGSLNSVTVTWLFQIHHVVEDRTTVRQIWLQPRNVEI